ncbi:putative pilus assembly protein CpaE [Anopheles sinensis]|uniref:Putative pilus assembly protein CpaE n=1 Tax=Anopheles sinensis TaxID=74873 RepID=A0A084VU89_ANOSI|nr:putative pilus assembly protein CpaE [Anopheles sinensis]
MGSSPLFLLRGVGTGFIHRQQPWEDGGGNASKPSRQGQTHQPRTPGPKSGPDLTIDIAPRFSVCLCSVANERTGAHHAGRKRTLLSGHNEAGRTIFQFNIIHYKADERGPIDIGECPGSGIAGFGSSSKSTGTTAISLQISHPLAQLSVANGHRD